ncbi:cation-chloride co-transporter [Trifolium repens]|nr:cation-chloride co-transporter [Trifolium repens]
MINRVAPAFLIPVLLTLICIYLGILLAKEDHPTEGVTALSMKTIKENWSSDYQKTNDAGILEPDGSVTWNFKLLCYYQFFYKGLLQFGSSKTVAEDLEFVTNIKEQFNFIQCVEANPTPLNLGTDSQDWSFSAIALLDG